MQDTEASMMTHPQAGSNDEAVVTSATATWLQPCLTVL